MLVLSRKAGEDVLIGNLISVSVVAIQGKRVKLAFTAPNEVVIRRAELVVSVDEPSCRTDETASVSSKPS
jgi:carbon storage regulator